MWLCLLRRCKRFTLRQLVRTWAHCSCSQVPPLARPRTCSGKTHAALQALRTAASGAYLGPLRLLAGEVADRLNSSGLACHLVTGQEVHQVEGAAHSACTVEMAPLEKALEVSGGGCVLV